MTRLSSKGLVSLAQAAQDCSSVTRFTHGFYPYPARFSPQFAQAIIATFTEPGDLVFDPYMGGGTTLVEAMSLGRRAIGTDINSIAHFVSTVKTTPLSETDIAIILSWTETIETRLNLWNPPQRAIDWMELGYQRNISGKKTWPIRKALELALADIHTLPEKRQQDFIRCALLRTAQWALDSRREIPSANRFRKQFLKVCDDMIAGIGELRDSAALNPFTHVLSKEQVPVCLHRSIIGIESDPTAKLFFPPKLILTSPPYPGVYMLYHRWKVQGRWETPAPFWIANSMDGHGMSYYTLGDRKQKHLDNYFNNLHSSFSSLSSVCNNDTRMVQMVGFSDPTWQLPRYLDVLSKCGFREIKFRDHFNSDDGRFWRSVPGRKWYASYQDTAKNTAKEVILFHRKM